MKKHCAICLLALFILGSFVLSGSAQQRAANEPLTLSELNNLLRRSVGRDMTEGDLASRIERVGIAFDPTPEIINRLRTLGAHPHLLNTIKRAAEKLTSAAGDVVTTRVTPPDPVIEEARKIVRDYLDDLPDFICQQEITRYIDTGTGGWEKADVLVYELTYNRRRETYKPVNSLGRPLTKPIDQVGGATSTGDFASMLASLFRPETKALFKPAGTEKLGTRQTVIYDFRVPRATSELSIKSNGVPPIIAGYSGSVWIDAETKRVLRIEQAADDLPRDYPVTQAERTVDYDIVKLRGLDVEFLLPIRAEVIIGDRRERHFSRNMIYFKFYRKFETDVKIVDDPTIKK
jgi:hypothetical protein